MKKLNQWIDRFAYSHPRFGIPNLMLYIVIANAATYILTMFAGSEALSFLEFDLYHLLHGEVWRLVTFVLLPFSYRPLSLFIMLSAVCPIFSRKSSVVRASTSAPRALTSTTLLMALSNRGA